MLYKIYIIYYIYIKILYVIYIIYILYYIIYIKLYTIYVIYKCQERYYVHLDLKTFSEQEQVFDSTVATETGEVLFKGTDVAFRKVGVGAEGMS